MSDLWPTPAEATTYMETRQGADDVWPSVEADQTTILTTAQADIEAPGIYTFEDDDGEDITDDPTDAMKEAVYEQALFRLLDEDVDVRAGIQAQGVTAATPVGETYNGLGAAITIAALAAARISTYQTGSTSSGPFTVTR